MIRYKRTLPSAVGTAIIRLDTDYPNVHYYFIEGTNQEYADWLAAGNTPEPVEPPLNPAPSLPERVQAIEMLLSLILAED